MTIELCVCLCACLCMFSYGVSFREDPHHQSTTVGTIGRYPSVYSQYSGYPFQLLREIKSSPATDSQNSLLSQE